MATLHTVNKSPFERNTLDACLRLAKAGSSVLFFEDGVYAALANTQVADKVRDAGMQLKLYVLGPDLAARGLADAPLVEGIDVVDYDGFVDLTSEYDRVQAWL